MADSGKDTEAGAEAAEGMADMQVRERGGEIRGGDEEYAMTAGP